MTDIGTDMQTPLLQVESLVVDFRKRRHRLEGKPAVNGISFSLDAGEILGVVGESGSGKTTLGRLLVGLQDMSSGKVFLDGVEITNSVVSKTKLRKSIQMVFQDSFASLDPGKPVGSLLREAYRLHHIASGQEVTTAIKELLHEVDLDPSLLERRPNELSGGQRQRMNFARALACNPRIIIADEPTSALDVTTRLIVLEFIKRLQQTRNIAVVFISHDLHVVRYLSDRVLVMHLGDQVELATSSDIYTKPQDSYTQKLITAVPTTREMLKNYGANPKDEKYFVRR